MSTLRLIAGDLWKVVAGAGWLVRWSFSKDDFVASVSSFSTPSTRVRRGESSRYEIHLANACADGRWFRLVLDVYWKDHPVHPGGHHAWFEKRVFLPPRQDQRVDAVYDWAGNAGFSIDGVDVPPDASWVGTCREPGLYFVKAVLRHRDEVVEELTLVQRLEEPPA